MDKVKHRQRIQNISYVYMYVTVTKKYPIKTVIVAGSGIDNRSYRTRLRFTLPLGKVCVNLFFPPATDNW